MVDSSFMKSFFMIDISANIFFICMFSFVSPSFIGVFIRLLSFIGCLTFVFLVLSPTSNSVTTQLSSYKKHGDAISSTKKLSRINNNYEYITATSTLFPVVFPVSLVPNIIEIHRKIPIKS